MHLIIIGNFFNKKMKIEVKEKEILFNDAQDEFMLELLEMQLNNRPPFGGTYYPQDIYEDINIYNVLANYFFDDKPTIELIENLAPIPYEEGIVY